MPNTHFRQLNTALRVLGQMAWMTLEGMRISMDEYERNTKTRAMLKNYLLTAIRSFYRDKVHTTINVAGLSLAIACCMLVAWFVKDELTFDRFHSRADRLFRVYNEENTGEKHVNTSTPFAMGPALKDNLAEIEGLATLATQSRIKEISIRKVLGATMPSLFLLLARDYVVLMGIAFTAAIPLIYWAMHNWLAVFEYRITIGPAPFLVAGGLSMLMMLLTVGHQVVKTARSQPAQTLKQE